MSSAISSPTGSGDDKDQKRRKQLKRMTKILESAWQESDPCFQQQDQDDGVFSLAAIGNKLDQMEYRLGKHGWEDFSKDLGGVYNLHVKKKTKRATLAKQTLDKILPLLPAPSLQDAASSHVPTAAAATTTSRNSKKKSPASSATKGHKKRSAASTSADADYNSPARGGDSQYESRTHSPARKKNKTQELADREDRSMELLRHFVTERGGDARLVENFTCRVTKKADTNAFNVNFYGANQRRFRSMLEVGRHFGLLEQGAAGQANSRNNNNKQSIRRKASSNESEAEKKQLRKELDKLRNRLKTATKALDNHASGASTAATNTADGKEAALADHVTGFDIEPVDDYLLEDGITRCSCAAARIPDITGFPMVPEHCIPDVLMAWDFLCTFSRAISLTPIGLDDFAAALTYTPPDGQLGDDVAAPPVYLAEAHLGLLKLLLQDAYSDDWWWATLETVEEETPDLLNLVDKGKPVIKVDMNALLSEQEDPLITNSWLKSLESVGKDATVTQLNEAKAAIKAALGLVSNKWVHAYLRKTLDASKLTNAAAFMCQSVLFLVKCVREARPDLINCTAPSEKVRQVKEKVVAEASEQMANLTPSAPCVANEDVVSDFEYESEDSDDEDAEHHGKGGIRHHRHSKEASENDILEADDYAKSASVIPPRPTPTIVDLLMPPTKPGPDSEYLNPFTWYAMVGATAHRVLHRKKRLLNEVDDYMRAQHDLKPPSVLERSEREKVAASRVLTECEIAMDGGSPTEAAIQHLCKGGHYLQLSTAERLCLLRLMIEAAYDTNRLYEVVNGNIKQRQSAMKALEVEQRRAKKDEKEKAIADASTARERLALEAKERFLDEKREEIRKLNEKSKELSDDVIESLTEEDIVDFDDDITADFLALPSPDFFSKADVKGMVDRMHEEAAFDCDSLRIITMTDLSERERRHLEEMEGQLAGFGVEDAAANSHLDKETFRSIDRLKRDIAKAKEQMEKLPALRQRAMMHLRDAIEDGTIKVLRAAITAAKRAKLSGPDEETGGVWAIDLMRDAALELDRAKASKRVIDAQRDLVLKRNKCFIRTEPLGIDRFANRFWKFDGDEDGRFWVETEYTFNEGAEPSRPAPGFLKLQRSPSQIAFGASEFEQDFNSREDLDSAEDFCRFSRREHHSNGFAPALAKHSWGCQATEESLRATIKLLNGRGFKEGTLKAELKESLEQTVGNDEKHENTDAVGTIEDVTAAVESADAVTEAVESLSSIVQTIGDSNAFMAAKNKAIPHGSQGATMNGHANNGLDLIESAMGQKVRVRQEIDGSRKDLAVARYENGTVVGWKYANEDKEANDDGEEMLSTPIVLTLEIPYWKVASERGHTLWLKGDALLQSMNRFEKWSRGQGYFEDDAAFFAYRNDLGKFLGGAKQAPYSCSPNSFASVMIKRESELYSKLKILSYDNKWGGKCGARALWTNSMKDYAFDFATVKQGLVTLEKAFFELIGEFPDYNDASGDEPNAKALLNDPFTRNDIELESIEKNIPGLWNSKASRLVFLEIVTSSKTTGILALCLDLLCRNTMAYLRKHKLLNNTEAGELFASEDYSYMDDTSGSRRVRGLNLWQRKKKTVNYEEFF
ncbi:hypothetical protein MPSEU_000944000 [Mayamaea pseudoterrestris]|nr:hypothetical protein MPSEU_000944000 [Mayamaea pseudoterrestris]